MSSKQRTEISKDAHKSGHFAGGFAGGFADRLFKSVALLCGLLILMVLTAVALFLLFQALPIVGANKSQVSQVFLDFTGGKAHDFLSYVAPMVFGTVLMSALALLLAFFVSIGIALFISHYAPPKMVPLLSGVVDLLAAIPSVIYGLWGGLVLVPSIYPFWKFISHIFGWIPLFAGPAASPSRSAATVSIVLAVMILPIIT